MSSSAMNLQGQTKASYVSHLMHYGLIKRTRLQPAAPRATCNYMVCCTCDLVICPTHAQRADFQVKCVELSNVTLQAEKESEDVVGDNKLHLGPNFQISLYDLNNN
jgi:hypothetical protein